MFFLEEFNHLRKPIGCHLNFDKTHIITSTNGTSSIPSIAWKYGKAVANSIETALETFSVSTSIVDGKPLSTRVKITTGLCLLGQPLRSTSFARSFFTDRLKANLEDSAKPVKTVPGPHTALRFFTQCTIHKLPHLMGSEVMYCFSETNYEWWSDWVGPMVVGIDDMVNSFLTCLTCRTYIPQYSLLISYVTIAQGGLGLMDAST